TFRLTLVRPPWPHALNPAMLRWRTDIIQTQTPKTTKPKRHPNTRLSSTPQQEHPSRGVHAPPDTPPPPPPNHPPKHPEKRN
ncbi:hypothetical protein M9458_011417, partial [Cirrhinus mrigala]